MSHSQLVSAPRLAIAYLRVSTDEQHLGPAAQRDAIERWASANGAAIIAFHLDTGASGATAIHKRPGLLAALEALTVHRARLLVVAKRDRLARDVVLAATIEAVAGRLGAHVVSAAGEGTAEGDAPSGLLMRRVVDAFAEYERAVIRVRTVAAMSVKRARGERVGAVPLGFRLAADGITLVKHAGEQRVVSRMRALRRDGHSYREIAAELNARGFAARGTRWHKTSVARVLSRS